MKTALILAAALLAPGAAVAHHGWANQEPDKVTTIEGPIQAVRYQNPHAEIEVTQAGQKWLVTLAPLSRMQARGVTEDSLKVGQTVKVEGHRSLTPGRMEVKANSISINGGAPASMLR